MKRTVLSNRSLIGKNPIEIPRDFEKARDFSGGEGAAAPLARASEAADWRTRDEEDGTRHWSTIHSGYVCYLKGRTKQFRSYQTVPPCVATQSLQSTRKCGSGLISQSVFIDCFWKVSSPPKSSTYCSVLLIKILN